MRLWTCPGCGVIGRLMHRYIAPFPKPVLPDDPGKCCEDQKTLEYVLERQKLRFPEGALT